MSTGEEESTTLAALTSMLKAANEELVRANGVAWQRQAEAKTAVIAAQKAFLKVQALENAKKDMEDVALDRYVLPKFCNCNDRRDSGDGEYCHECRAPLPPVDWCAN